MRNVMGIPVVFLCSATAMATDFAGIWKLDLKKSKMRSADITAETMTIEKTGPNSYRTSVDVTYSSGQTFHAARARMRRERAPGKWR